MAATYAIAAIAKMTGLSADMLRAWERRYGIVTPVRDAIGARRYSDEDVVRLRLARAATALGHPIRLVAKLSDEELRRLVRSEDEHASVDAAAEPTLRAVLDALARYDLHQAENVLNAAALLMATEDLLLHVLVPLMRAVGVRWESGRLSIAQEHLVSHLVRNLIGRLARLRPTEGGDAVLFATPPGEPHEFGIDVAAALASLQGLRSCVLGPNVPALELCAAARRLRPRTVVIGTTLGMEDGGLAAYLHALDARLPARTRLWIGGEGGREDRAGWPERAEYLAGLEAYRDRIASRRA